MVGVSIGIIVILFCIQSYGTGRVGPSFSPIVMLWCVNAHVSQPRNPYRVLAWSSKQAMHHLGEVLVNYDIFLDVELPLDAVQSAWDQVGTVVPMGFFKVPVCSV